MNTLIPLKIKAGTLATYTDVKESIDAHVELLLTTPVGSCISDPNFGFILNNLRFEIFNENEGVVLNSEEEHSDLYEKKVSGSSRNVNTFAIELKQLIERYEQRLEDVQVTMSYIREHRRIYITVRGIISQTQTNYSYQTCMRVWN
jgi:predicted component of type VI protein secretion system